VPAGRCIFGTPGSRRLAERRPYCVTVSVYGATASGYDALTRRRGSFARFQRGLIAAHEAGLPLRLNLIVTRHNAHEEDQMIAMAERFGVPHHVYSSMSPTIYGGPESLPAQSAGHLRQRKPFTGCNAGHTFFHVDPHCRASICKPARRRRQDRAEARLPLRRAPPLLRPPQRRRADILHRPTRRQQLHRPRLVSSHGTDRSPCSVIPRISREARRCRAGRDPRC
jgi:MoaA/NifB/PqqE/SkfB family radical SAM enzyme